MPDGHDDHGRDLDDLAQLESRLGVRFNDRALLAQALVHRSLVNEADLGRADSNERLEFLGDAVLGLVTAELLSARYPDWTEGQLSHARASLVNLSALSSMGASVELGAYLQLGRGEDLNGGRTRASVVGRAFEALLGALYLDQGLDAPRLLLARVMLRGVERYDRSEPSKGSKTQLQEFLQARRGTTPDYALVSDEGPDHAKTFRMAVRAGGTVLAVGEGSSKQRAEQAAARSALAALRATGESRHREHGRDGQRDDLRAAGGASGGAADVPASD